MTARSNAIRTTIRIMIHQLLPFSSESRKNFRIRRIASLSLLSVRSTFCSRSVNILKGGQFGVPTTDRDNPLVVFSDLLAHQACLLCNSIQSTRYRVHRVVLFSNHHLLVENKSLIPGEHESLILRGQYLLFLSCPCRLVIVPISG